MRVPAILLATTVVLPGGAASAAEVKVKPDAPLPAARHCPPTVNDYLAQQMNQYRGPRLAPKKLTELPPATTYMAVLREIGGCDAPLTMVDYRNPRRR